MTTTTNYGSWYNNEGHELTVEASVGTALGDYGHEYDMDAIASDWRAAINAGLPDHVALSGDEFYGPAYEADQDFEGYELDEDGNLDIKAIIEAIDFWEIAARHELWTIDQVAEELKYSGPSAAGAARKRLSAWKVKAHSYQPHSESGRPRALYRAGEVRAAIAKRPGRGARTDLTESA